MTETAKKIEVFYGISSPWAYMGAERVKAIAAEAGAEVKLRPIKVIEANGGILMRNRPLSRQQYHEVEKTRWSRHLGIPLNNAPKFYPCRSVEPACHAVIAADLAGYEVQDFSFAIQRALWAEDRDIADHDELRAIARQVLGAEAAELIREEQTEEVVAVWRGNLAEAERIGIFGTPTYVVNGELFWGQDRLDFVVQALRGETQPILLDL